MPGKKQSSEARSAKPEIAPGQYEIFRREELIDILEQRDSQEAGGIRMTYEGQTPPWQIIRRVQPWRQRIESRISVGSEEAQALNSIVEGENLQAMVSLYKYRGQVDLVLTDPPYNTGQDFRYNDRWEADPNDPDLGLLVSADDGSKHSKWLRFMTPRLWMMREMLRPGGVLAICIDHRELFRLGMLLDQVFGEENRLGIINWQKSYAPRNDQQHLSTATEYVLVYSKNSDKTVTGLLPRTAQMNARYLSPDGDPQIWKPGDLTAPGAATHRSMVYAIQSPFTGDLHYPSPGRCWGSEKKRMKTWLEAWGSTYQELDLLDGHPPALVLKAAFDAKPSKKRTMNEAVLQRARSTAETIRAQGNWPEAHWRDNGLGTFGCKKYLSHVKQGIVPTTYWAEDDYDQKLDIGATSWEHTQSGHSQIGVNELSAIVGRTHGFDTVKPLKLVKKIIQIWCPPNGVVMDPFAGSGTTGHAVLDLNQESAATRRFLLIEQGRPERGDPYARGLTAQRLANVISGNWASGKRQGLPGGFRFTQLSKRVDAEGVLALEREEMLDLLITSHWDQNERGSSHLQRLPAGSHKHLFAKSARGEGYFLLWSGPSNDSVLNRESFRAIAEEARKEGLSAPYHVYARVSTYSGPNIEFYQIPNRILEKLGFNEATQPYNTAND